MKNNLILSLIKRTINRINKRKHKSGRSSQDTFNQNPLVTSTPPNFKILPMNQLLNQRDTWTEDFKIYDEFCENHFINTQNDLCQDRIYQNLVELVEGSAEVGNIFNFRSLAGQEENEYEIVNVQRKPLNRKIRSLKSMKTKI